MIYFLSKRHSGLTPLFSQKIHTGIAHARKDFLHKTTTTISQNHALVCVEDLQVRNMSKFSKGSVETPEKMSAKSPA